MHLCKASLGYFFSQVQRNVSQCKPTKQGPSHLLIPSFPLEFARSPWRRAYPWNSGSRLPASARTGSVDLVVLRMSSSNRVRVSGSYHCPIFSTEHLLPSDWSIYLQLLISVTVYGYFLILRDTTVMILWVRAPTGLLHRGRPSLPHPPQYH